MKPFAQAVAGALIVAFLPGLGFGQVKSGEPVKTVRISGRVEDQTSRGQKTKPASRLWAAITVPQPIFEEGGEVEHLQIDFGVVNDGHSTVNPNVESSHLFINGVEPQDWRMVIGNGGRSSWFYA